MKPTNNRIIVALLTFLISILLVYVINGNVHPVWDDSQGYDEKCHS